MCEKIKKWWDKSKTAVIIILTSFGAGIATAFGVFSRRNSDSKQYIRQLEDKLDEYLKLNNELDRLNGEFANRLSKLSDSNNELTKQNTELRKLNDETKRTVELTRADINNARQSIGSGIDKVGQLSDIASRLQQQSEKLANGLNQLEKIVKQSRDEKQYTDGWFDNSNHSSTN